MSFFEGRCLKIEARRRSMSTRRAAAVNAKLGVGCLWRIKTTFPIAVAIAPVRVYHRPRTDVYRGAADSATACIAAATPSCAFWPQRFDANAWI